MIYAYRTDRGLRQCNEDCCYTPDGEACPLAVVADGMGGHRAGNIASLLAVESIVEYTEKNNASKKQQLLQKAVSVANHRIFDIASKDEDCMGMGTTVVIAYAEATRFTYAYVGDSRLYHFDGSKLRRITRDHSFVEELVSAGLITPEQARVHPQRNILTRAVGTAQFVKAATGVCSWLTGDILMLCSDGLHGSVEDTVMEQILRSTGDLLDACDRLTELALENGSKDNITVVLVKNSSEEEL